MNCECSVIILCVFWNVIETVIYDEMNTGFNLEKLHYIHDAL